MEVSCSLLGTSSCFAELTVFTSELSPSSVNELGSILEEYENWSFEDSPLSWESMVPFVQPLLAFAILLLSRRFSIESLLSITLIVRSR